VFERRRLIGTCAIAIGVVACLSTPARAATVPNGAVVCVDRPIDVAAFARMVANRYHVVLQRVVAADIDRDGDLDVLASTDREFLVWVNDGAGRLTSQAPKPHSAIDGHSAPDTWNGAEPPDEAAIQNESPSPRLPGARPHAPPGSISRTAVCVDAAPRASAPHDQSAPRAPPSFAFSTSNS
jgi:hypothetical protein